MAFGAASIHRLEQCALQRQPECAHFRSMYQLRADRHSFDGLPAAADQTAIEHARPLLQDGGGAEKPAYCRIARAVGK